MTEIILVVVLTLVLNGLIFYLGYLTGECAAYDRFINMMEEMSDNILLSRVKVSGKK